MVFWRKTARRRKASVATLKHLFHGIAVNAGKDACDAAREISGHRFLSEDAPRLPLDSCTCQPDCRCTYQHFKDRRTESRREADLGLPVRHVLDEKRQGAGRRITDH